MSPNHLIFSPTSGSPLLYDGIQQCYNFDACTYVANRVFFFFFLAIELPIQVDSHGIPSIDTLLPILRYHTIKNLANRE